MRKVDDPLVTFGEWLEEATAREPEIPEACALATAGTDGQPSVRMVLLKGWGESGFEFFTHFESRKGRELAANPRAAMLFHWKSLDRQVRIEGKVERLSDERNDAYFDSRERMSRIGAWASLQSRPMSGRLEFEQRIAVFGAKYAVGRIPRPSGWGGYRIVAERIEFWEDRPFRLHLRHQYTRGPEGWDFAELYP